MKSGMKKIGLLTYYATHNYGTALQCFALKQAIEAMGDHEVEVIPYMYLPIDKTVNGFSGEKLRAAYDRRIEAFYAFQQEILGCRKKRIEKLTAEEADYDACIVGSDTVWDINQNNDESYFLGWVPKGTKKISYAASTAERALMTERHLECFRKYLKDFDAISVREGYLAETIEKVTGRHAETVLDPTLLLSREDYEPLEEPADLPKSPYILVYWVNYDNAATHYVHQMVNRLAIERNMEVVHFIYNAPYYLFSGKDKTMAFATIGEFLTYLRNASMVFTSSFHGTTLSLVYRKPFYTFCPGGAESRSGSLLGRIGLEDRMLCPDLDLGSKKTGDRYDNACVEALEREIERSKAFLRNALEEG